MRSSSRHPSAARFHQILKEIGQLHDKKQKDYGSKTDPFANVRKAERWGVPAWVYAMLRVDEKLTRLQSLRQKGRLENESADDSFRDIGVYSLIALVLFEERKKKWRKEPKSNPRRKARAETSRR